MKPGPPNFLLFASALFEITQMLRWRFFAWVFFAAAFLCWNGKPVLGQDTEAIGFAESTVSPSATLTPTPTSTPTPTPAASKSPNEPTPTSEGIEIEPPPLPGTTPTPPISVEEEATPTPTPSPSPVVEAPLPIIPIQAGTTPGSPISTVVTQPGLPGPVSAVPSGISLRSQAYVPLRISLSLQGGFDDNFQTTQSAQGSWFTTPAVSFLYDLPGTSTQLIVHGDANYTYYLNQGSSGGGTAGSQQSDNINVDVGTTIIHNVSERLKLEATLYAAYRAEPDLSSNVGFQNRQGNYFNTNDSLGVTYHWSPRFFTVTTDRFDLVDYGNSSQGGTSQNRIDNTVDQEFKYDLVHHGTTAVLEYRFEISDYQDSSLNSLTNFVVVGFDQEFSPLFRATIRAGASVSSFASDGSQVTPHFESSLIYAGAHNSLVSWTTMYGTENASAAGVLSQTTFRTGLEFKYGLTARITASLNAYYAHSTNQGTVPGVSGGTSGSTGNSAPNASRNTVESFLACRYVMNPRWAFNLSVEYTMDNSSDATSDYTRLRYSGGLSYTF